jgi:hypothetical protein
MVEDLSKAKSELRHEREVACGSRRTVSKPSSGPC